MPDERSPSALRLLTVPLDALWRQIATPRAAAALAFLAAGAIALGLALPQAPWTAGRDAQTLARWLADLQIQEGSWVAWPARLGLLSLYSSLAFRLVWAALGFALLIATADGLLAWRERASGRPIPWRLLAHAGLLLLLAGSLVEERWGWEQDRLLLDGSAPVAVGQGLLLQRPRAQDAPSLPGVVVLWRRAGAQGELRLVDGMPQAVGPVTLHLRQAGSAVSIRVADGSGRAVPLDDPESGGYMQPEATLRFQQAATSRYLGVPAKDWVIRVAYEPANLGGSPFTLWVYRGLTTTPLAQATLGQAGELTIGEARLSWQILPYAEVRAALHPGLGLWIVGWLLMCVGLGAGMASEWKGRTGWAWPVAGAGLGAALWLAAGGWPLAQLSVLAALGALALAWAAAALFLAALGGLLVASGRQMPLPVVWPAAPHGVLLAWTVGGGLAVLAHWLAAGALWRWEAPQAWWGLAWCLLVAARHVQATRRQWMFLAWLGLAGLLISIVLGGARFSIAWIA